MSGTDEGVGACAIALLFLLVVALWPDRKSAAPPERLPSPEPDMIEGERWATLPSSRPWDRLPRNEEPRRPHRVLFHWRGWTLWKDGAR